MDTLTSDTLTGLLDGPRARGAFLLRSILNPPWALRIEDEAPLSMATMVRGQAWVIPDDGEPVLLEPGDVAIMRGPEPFTMADTPDTRVQISIGPGQRCTTEEGPDITHAMELGVRTWGDSLDGPTVMLSGVYQMHSEVGQRLLGALPSLLVRRTDGEMGPLISLLSSEIDKTAPGQELVLDRILDLLMVNILRNWLADPGAGAPAWYRAQHDPIVGPALRMLHSDPAYQWTVANLAAKTGVSRAALARRFTTLVGEPPMMYLTGWRLALAADSLREPGATLASVARRVGYSSAFALSTAFKRVRGVTPQEHRKTADTGARPISVSA